MRYNQNRNNLKKNPRPPSPLKRRERDCENFVSRKTPPKKFDAKVTPPKVRCDTWDEHTFMHACDTQVVKKNVRRGTKSAWVATSLMTTAAVYDALTTPTVESCAPAHECLYFKGVPEGCMPYSPPQDAGMSGMCFCLFLFNFILFY